MSVASTVPRPAQNQHGPAACRLGSQPTEGAQAIHRALQGLALFWSAKRAVALDDVACRDAYQSVGDDVAGDPGGMGGLLTTEHDAIGPQQHWGEDLSHVDADSCGGLRGDGIGRRPDVASGACGGDLHQVEDEAQAGERPGPLAKRRLELRRRVGPEAHGARGGIDAFSGGMGVGM